MQAEVGPNAVRVPQKINAAKPAITVLSVVGIVYLMGDHATGPQYLPRTLKKIFYYWQWNVL